MKNFIEIYNRNEMLAARREVKRAVAFYCLFAVVFAGFCAAFVALYLVAGLNVFICFFANFIATVAFAWYSVLFFWVTFKRKRAEEYFYKIFENADTERFTGKFLGFGGEVVEDGIGFTLLQFEEAEGFFIKKEKNAPFTVGARYDLKLIGRRVLAYRECEDD